MVLKLSLSYFIQAHRLTHQRKQLKIEARETNLAKNLTKSEASADGVNQKVFTAQTKTDFDGPLLVQQIQEGHYGDTNDVEIDPRLFCDFPGCSFSTKSSSNLTQHLRVHNDEKNFECSICCQKFRSSSNLKVHIKSIHTKERVFTCDFCEKRFATKWQKKSHTKTCLLYTSPSPRDATHSRMPSSA